MCQRWLRVNKTSVFAPLLWPNLSRSCERNTVPVKSYDLLMVLQELPWAWDPGTTPSTKSPQSHRSPSLPPLPSSLLGGGQYRESEYALKKRCGFWAPGGSGLGPGWPPGWPSLRRRQKTLRKAVHSGLLAPDPENTIIAIAEWLLLQYIHREWRLFLLPLLVVSLIPVSSKCGKSYALQPGAIRCCLARLLANVQERFID